VITNMYNYPAFMFPTMVERKVIRERPQCMLLFRLYIYR